MCDTYDCDYLPHTTFRFYLIDPLRDVTSRSKEVALNIYERSDEY